MQRQERESEGIKKTKKEKMADKKKNSEKKRKGKEKPAWPRAWEGLANPTHPFGPLPCNNHSAARVDLLRWSFYLRRRSPGLSTQRPNARAS